MRYVFLVYQDAAIVEAMDECRRHALAEEAVAYRELLRQGGQLLTTLVIQPASALTVRVRNGESTIEDGRLRRTREQLGAVWLIEARDLNEAIRLAARLPEACLGSVEVRPVVQEESYR